jgi:predicted HTH transcriptional regulator
MNWQTFIALIQKSEEHTIFIPNTKNEIPVGQTISGLLNTNGGKLIIGYDKVNVHLTGFDQPDQWVDEFIETHFNQTSIVYSFLFRSNKKVLILDIEKNKHELPYQGLYYKIEDNKAIEFIPIKKIPIQTTEQIKSEPIKTPLSLDTTTETESTYPNTSEILPSTSISTNIIEKETNTTQTYTEPTITNNHTPQAPQEKTVPSYRTETTSEPQSESPPETVTIQTETTTPPFVPITQKTTPDQIIQEPASLNQRQKKALKYVKKHGSIRNKLYRKLFSVSHKTAHIELVDMVQHNLIVSSGLGRSTCYILAEHLKEANLEKENNTLKTLSEQFNTINDPTTSITQTPFTSPDIVTSFVTRHSMITETMYANEFNMDMANAIKELEQHCNAGLLEKTIQNNQTAYIKTSQTRHYQETH